MFKELIYELSRGFAYRGIAHSGMHMYTRWLPLIITIIVVLAYIALPSKPPIVGEKALAASLLTIVSTLPGFYFAGLAAVSTFGNTTMDHEMPAPAPEVEMVVAGTEVKVKLTRRLFLSYLFSYLVILSFVLCVALVGLNALSGSIDALQTYLAQVSDSVWPWRIVKGLTGTALVFAFASMVITTLHGVFFLTEKIHQP